MARTTDRSLLLWAAATCAAWLLVTPSGPASALERGLPKPLSSLRPTDSHSRVSTDVSQARGDTPAIDRLFDEFFSQDSPRGAERVAQRLLREGVTYEEALARFGRGRSYKKDVERGEVRWISPHSPRVGVRTIVLVPRDYDASFAYPVRIQLHSDVGLMDPPGVGRRRFDPRLGTRLESSRATIHVLPAAFADAQWWFANQVDNLQWIVDRLKRTYNVDENHVHLLGVSDGGTGAFFFAMRDTTPWSSFVSLNGSPRVLTNADLRVDGDMYATNLVNKPFYVVNGGRDPQYPAASVAPFVELFRRVGADISFRPKPGAGHETTWWDEEQFEVDDFVDESVRDPLPARLSWRTERVDRYNRAHWLIITRLTDSADTTAARDDVSGLDDVNDVRIEAKDDFGLRIDLKVASGRRVVQVVADSDAERTGLRRGDTLVEIDGVRVRDGRQVVELLARHEADRAIVFTIEREGKRQSLSAPFPPTDAPPRADPAFPRSGPSGRVDLEQRGNRVDARAVGVASFTLLLSPSRFDFSKPIVVTVNGREVVNRTVTPDVAALLKWAAADNDRTMLFGAELPIEVPE